MNLLNEAAFYDESNLERGFCWQASLWALCALEVGFVPVNP